MTAGPRRWVAVTAIALCVSALIATGCGDSAAEMEAACWAKYEAIAAEMAAVAAMDRDEIERTYDVGVDGGFAFVYLDVLPILKLQLPDCQR